MLRFILLIVALLQLVATPLPQDLTLKLPQDPHPGEKRTPPGHYCMNHAPRPNETRAHECHCDYVCEVDGEGVETGEYHAAYQCLNYCEAALKACTCHPEEPCPKFKEGVGNVYPGHVHQGYIDKYGDPFKKE